MEKLAQIWIWENHHKSGMDVDGEQIERNALLHNASSQVFDFAIVLTEDWHRVWHNESISHISDY